MAEPTPATSKKTMHQRFDEIDSAIRGSEGSIINVISALAPWGAPLAPAWMSLTHMQVDLAFPRWVAITLALVVEILGLSTIHTALEFWAHNQRYARALRQEQYKQAPLGMVVTTFFCYLAIVLLLNVGLEISHLPSMKAAQPGIRIAAYGILTLMTIPAGLIIALRAQHSALIEDIADEKRRRRLIRQGVDPDTMKPVVKITETPAPVNPNGVPLGAEPVVKTYWREHGLSDGQWVSPRVIAEEGIINKYHLDPNQPVDGIYSDEFNRLYQAVRAYFARNGVHKPE